MIVTINAFDLIGLVILGVALIGCVILFIADRIAYAVEKRLQERLEEAYVEMEEDYTE